MNTNTISSLLVATVLCFFSAGASTAQIPVVKPPKPDVKINIDTSWIKEMQKSLEEQKWLQYDIQKKMEESMAARHNYDIAIKNMTDLSDHSRYIDVGQFYGQDGQSSQLTLRKSYNAESASKKTSFLVDESHKRISFNVSGECEQGEIRIIITKPGGQLLQEIIIDPSAGVEWSQSFQIGEQPGIVVTRPYSKASSGAVIVTTSAPSDKEKEAHSKQAEEKKKELIGNWQIEINAKNAKGSYELRIFAR